MTSAGTQGWADVGAFVDRLLRMDRNAVVRIRTARLWPGAGLVELWARLPFAVLVARPVRLPQGSRGLSAGTKASTASAHPDAAPRSDAPLDVTLTAASLLAALNASGQNGSPE